jgi:hypothetical protein
MSLASKKRQPGCELRLSAEKGTVVLSQKHIRRLYIRRWKYRYISKCHIRRKFSGKTKIEQNKKFSDISAEILDGTVDGER